MGRDTPACGTGHYGGLVQTQVAGTVTAKSAKGTGGPAGDECQNLVIGTLRHHPRPGSNTIGATVAVAHTLLGKHNLSHDGSRDAIVAVDAGQDPCVYEEHVGALNRRTPHAVATSTVVRRITPLEGERLMGFPDNWTLVPYGKRTKMMRDGPRYELIGNSIAVNCIRWIGERIAMFERVTTTETGR